MLTIKLLTKLSKCICPILSVSNATQKEVVHNNPHNALAFLRHGSHNS